MSQRGNPLRLSLASPATRWRSNLGVSILELVKRNRLHPAGRVTAAPLGVSLSSHVRSEGCPSSLKWLHGFIIPTRGQKREEPPSILGFGNFFGISWESSLSLQRSPPAEPMSKNNDKQ